MKPIIKNLKSFGGFILLLAIGMIALVYILQLAGSKGWGPISSVANFTSAHITPASPVATTVVAPANQVSTNYHSF
jgi:hypothetical protein